MSPKRKNTDSRTLNLPFADLDVKKQLEGLLRRAADKSGKKLETIAAEVSQRTGRQISPAMLSNYWSQAEDKEPYNFPAWLLAAFCAVCGDFEPYIFIGKNLGLGAVTQEIVDLAEYGRIYLEEKRLSSKKQALEWKLKL